MVHAHELTYVGTLCTLPGTWVDVFAATLIMVHVHEVAYMLVTELKKRGTENGNDGAHNSLQIPLAVCFGSRPHGIARPFSKDRCSQNTARVAKKHCTQLLNMLISSGTSRPRLAFVVTRAPVLPHLSRSFPTFYRDGL
jgi:hypothetical protein